MLPMFPINKRARMFVMLLAAISISLIIVCSPFAAHADTLYHPTRDVVSSRNTSWRDGNRAYPVPSSPTTLNGVSHTISPTLHISPPSPDTDIHLTNAVPIYLPQVFLRSFPPYTHSYYIDRLDPQGFLNFGCNVGKEHNFGIVILAFGQPDKMEFRYVMVANQSH